MPDRETRQELYIETILETDCNRKYMEGIYIAESNRIESGASKVNTVYSKTRFKSYFTQSRDANLPKIALVRRVLAWTPDFIWIVGSIPTKSTVLWPGNLYQAV
jgi:hypothetical protein